jgi:hypothetical protein
MLFALTKATTTTKADTVWVTFIDTCMGIYTSFHTALALDHIASNIKLSDIDYEFVLPEFG